MRLATYRKGRVEDCVRLSIFTLNGLGKLKAPESARVHSVTVNDQNILITNTPCYFGGVRYWFECPACDRRVGLLYKPSHSQNYLCRDCHNLTYTLRQVHRDIFYSVWRMIKARDRFAEVVEGVGRKGLSKLEALQIAKLKRKVNKADTLIERTEF